ncbi:MAG: tRNA (guanosine(46)-N7)-methyltransferase TrmB [Myxococcota bacterium]
MARRLKLEIPGPDWRRTGETLREHGWKSLFAPVLEAPAGLVVEIGFGRGEFLISQARRHPRIAYLGIELSYKRTLKMARRLARGDLVNLRLLHTSAELVVRPLLPERSVDAFWINFSDPWPKKRHARRRLMRAAFVRDLAHCLVPGGALHVATDHVPYAAQIHERLQGEGLLQNALAPAPWVPEIAGREPTTYELEWRADGRPLHFFHYTRRE